MDKHDPIVTVAPYSGPRGCAVLMHTTFSLTRKSLSKFTGMHSSIADFSDSGMRGEFTRQKSEDDGRYFRFFHFMARCTVVAA